MSNITSINLDHKLARIESKLNIAGYIPIISSISGSARIAIGSIEQTLGSVGAIFRGADYIFTKDKATRNLAAENFWYSYHGQTNIARGCIEVIPVIGNFLTLFYDYIMELRVNYTHEELGNGASPVLDDSKAVPKTI